MEIRRARHSDLDQLTALWFELAKYHEGFVPEFKLESGCESSVRAYLEEALTDDDDCIFVAEANNNIVGYIRGQVRENPPVFRERFIGHIADAVVTEHSRNRSVGMVLVDAMNQWFRDHSVRIVHLSAATDNSVAQAFWRKMGFAGYMTQMRCELT
jgi:ribosomal protein S18 acetylase RimI-like enzyme